ncbi:MAG: hypothetical protein OJF55_002197 [Rhodanobacteraceae bacterium]|jgi:hypothetical protein|nr:MAG: hypothetical protein OJF55_002197 [Rhodanobacteraceae bacterium]
MTASIGVLALPARERAGRTALKLFAALLWAGVIVFFSFRAVPTSLDDNNYIHYFNGTETEYVVSRSAVDRAYVYVTNEPAWRLYCYLMGSAFSPEDCVRITIGLGLLLLAIAAFLGGRPLLFLAMYVVNAGLLFNINYTQIRQGFALAVFLLAIRFCRSFKISAFLACLIHSSFILLVMAAFARGVKTRSQLLLAMLVSSIGGLVLFTQVGVSGLLGRRTQYLSWNDSNNLNFWIGSIAFMIAAFLLARWYAHKKNDISRQVEMLDISVFNSIGAMLFSILLAPVAGRFMLNSDALQISALSDRKVPRDEPFWLFLGGWMVFQAYELHSHIGKGLDFFVTFHSLL